MKWEIILAAIVAIFFSAQFDSLAHDKLESRANVLNTIGKLPTYFIENQGQLDEEVAYYVKGSDKNLYFTSNGIAFVLKGDCDDDMNRWGINLEFVGANPHIEPEGKSLQKTIFSYFKGNPDEWKTSIRTYSNLIYENLWPGVTLRYFNMNNHLKYDFVLKPNVNPSIIQLMYEGATGLHVNEKGEFIANTPFGSIHDSKPLAYQIVNGIHVDIPITYELEDNILSFFIEDYDPSLYLIIDPAIIMYCGYIGGIENDFGKGISVDSQGNSYIAGFTKSDETSFPVKVGPYLNHNSNFDAFVAKINNEGTDLIYCGYIGGSSLDEAQSLAVDHSGRAYVAGRTCCTESSFPVKVGPDLTYNGDMYDVFVARISEDGTNIEYCGYIGGADREGAWGIAVDHNGNAFVAGYTHSDESTFPVYLGPDLSSNGGPDGFIAKVGSDGSILEYCGYIGGSNTDDIQDVSVDDQGSAYVVGNTRSLENDFPVKVGPDLTHNGGDFDAFIAKLSISGEELVYCGYIGGSEYDSASGVAVDNNACAYVTGNTLSKEDSFPVQVGPDLTYNGGTTYYGDAYVSKINKHGTALDYCGYIGGNAWDSGRSISVDKRGFAHVCGDTSSNKDSFPVKNGPILSHSGGKDVFVAGIHHTGSELEYCGYIGGKGNDYCSDIANDTFGNIYITGHTASNEKTFPVSIGPDLTYNGGDSDGLVAKVSMALSCDSQFISARTGGLVHLKLFSGKENAKRNYLMLGSVSGVDPGTLLPGGLVVLPLNLDHFTSYIVMMMNSQIFNNFMGELNESGCSSAIFNTYGLGAISPGCIGTVMYFAYCLDNPFDFASNPIGIEIVF